MQQSEFICGVVEGFYGKPWTLQERFSLFEQISSWGLNAYFYAPKDDLKHRAIWRECYSGDELASICALVEKCHAHGLKFIYGLSPGLDIQFGEASETDRIKSRFAQLMQIGVRDFALLFDDLPANKSTEILVRYPSLAAAHCDITNSVVDWIRRQIGSASFLFCPTPYCGEMDRAGVGGKGYLDDVGRRLDLQIDVLWTGPEIVSREISVDSIERLTERIGRRPVLWDNLFANDYDFHRLHCGPYDGRTRDLLSVTRGILVNPNNEYLANFVPLCTLADFAGGEGEWDPRKSYLRALAEWILRFETVIHPLAFDDLLLLADCYYLPHMEGLEARRLLELIERLVSAPVDSWGAAYEEFSSLNRRIQAIFERLTELSDRELFYAWSRYGWSLKEELQSIDIVLDHKAAGGDVGANFDLGDLLPGTMRGGLISKLERFLELDDDGKVRLRTAS